MNATHPADMHTIRLLGGASICNATDAANSRAIPRARMAVLAILALSKSRSATRDRLMGLVWPDSDATRARHQLREALYRLREILGDEALTSNGDQIHLSSFVSCDAVDFETAIAQKQWSDADRLYAGPLLDGFFLSGSTEFERWVDGQRTRFLTMHREALEAETAECTVRGDSTRLLAVARRWAEADPYSAKPALALMNALSAAGDRVAALRHAAAYESLLKADLDAEPDAAVVALTELLRRAPTPAVANMEAVMPSAARDLARGETQRTSATSRRRPWRFALSATAAALIVGTAFVRARLVDARNSDDALRLVVAPFRVSSSDSSLSFLRDGLVELLSTQFTGDLGPAAVDAGEVLRAGSSAPVTAVDARALAAKLHAGQVLHGSIVGTSRELTVSASILETSTGVVRAGPVLASGPIDSLASIISQLSARLLARHAGADGVEQTSNEVLRAFVHGMAEYRRANWIAAGTELFRAFELDSSFTPATFRFALIHAITAPRTPLGDGPSRDARFTRLYGLLWQQRQRLRTEDRRLVEAVADSLYVRWPMQSLPRLESVVELLPNSPEAWDILGDDYYHAGALVGHDDWLDRAKRSFTRAMALDSTIALNAIAHLPDIAFIERDSRAFDALAPRSVVGRGRAYREYLSALLRHDAGDIRSARAEYARSWARGEDDGIDWAVQGVSLPQHELDSLLIQLDQSANTPEQRRTVTDWSIDAAALGGRPARAAILLERANGADTGATDISILSYGFSSRAVEDRVLQRSLAAGERQLHPEACNVALARLRRGDSTGATSILATEPRMDDALPASEVVHTVRRGLKAQAAICGQVLRGVLASLSPSGDRWLLRADSMMRNVQINYGALWNYDVAHALARRGHYALASAAARRNFVDRGPVPRLTLSLRDEGRWAALAGDTTHAIAAYRHYLLWRESPEPLLVPERDSVRAELDRLLRKR